MTKGITPSLVQSIREATRQGEVGEAAGSLNEAGIKPTNQALRNEERQYSKATETKAKEIADAIHRDNPSFPKDKVMKIAWAQAKKTVAEQKQVLHARHTVKVSNPRLSAGKKWAAAKSSKQGGSGDPSSGDDQ